MGLNLAKAVISYLKERSEQKFTARQIAEWLYDNFPNECQEKRQNSTRISNDAQLVDQLAAEIGSRLPTLLKRCPELKTTEGRPRKYYYSQRSDSAEVTAVESALAGGVGDRGQPRLVEQDLYPLLSHYLRNEFGLYSLRINEKRSSNTGGRGGNHWLHPDLVGMEDLGQEWAKEVQDCVHECSDKRTKLWSFEVKLLLNRSNVRECFFQAVSNSSWANFGYLVAMDISGPDTLKELRMLFAAHGIGLMQLDAENPADSQVLIPARERDAIDWDMVNRLATENQDFQNYVQLVCEFYRNGKVKEHEWAVPEQQD